MNCDTSLWGALPELQEESENSELELLHQEEEEEEEKEEPATPAALREHLHCQPRLGLFRERHRGVLPRQTPRHHL